MRATRNDNPKVWENRMRREARRQGYELFKVRGADLWILQRPRERTYNGFSDTNPQHLNSLYEVDEYLRKQREHREAQGMPNPPLPGQSRVSTSLDAQVRHSSGSQKPNAGYDVPDNAGTHRCAGGNPYMREAALAVA